MRWEAALQATTTFAAWESFDSLVHATSLAARSRCPLLVDLLSLSLSHGHSDITPLSGGEAVLLSLDASPGSLTLLHGARICSEEGFASHASLGGCGAPLTMRTAVGVWGGGCCGGERGLPAAVGVRVGRVDECDEMFWRGCVDATGAAGEVGAGMREGGSRAARGFARVVAGAMMTRGGVGVGMIEEGVVVVDVCGEEVKVSGVYRGVEGGFAVAAGLGEGVRRGRAGGGEGVRKRVVGVGRWVGKGRESEVEEVVGRGVGWIRVRVGGEVRVVWDGGEQVRRREVERAVREVGEGEVDREVGREWRLDGEAEREREGEGGRG